MLFLAFSVLLANPKKLLYTVANPARGLLNGEKIIEAKVWQPPSPSLHQRCSFGENKIKPRDASTCLGATQVLVRLAPLQNYFGSSTGPMDAASQNSTLPCDFPSLVASLFFWRCLAASTSYFLHAAKNLRPPSVTVSTHISTSDAVAFHGSTGQSCQFSSCSWSAIQVK